MDRQMGYPAPEAMGKTWRLLAGCGLALATVLTLLKYSIEIPHIFWNPANGAIDLRYYFEWAHGWADGINVYALPVRAANHPPASLVVLYPITGWLDWPATRILWGSLSLAGISVLLSVALVVAKPRNGMAWIAIALLVLSNNGMGTALGNGQLIPLMLPLILAAVFLARQKSTAIWTDLGISLLMVAGSAKPHLLLPFVWVVLIQAGTFRLRAILLAAVLYGVLTLFSAAAIHEPVHKLLQQCLREAVATITYTKNQGAFEPNIHFVLAKLGYHRLMAPASLAMVLGLGIWVFRHRKTDLWLLLGVSGLVARLYVYHRVYDDVLLLLVEIALWRISTRAQTKGIRITARWLLIAYGILLLAPGNFHASLPGSFWLIQGVLQGMMGVATLCWLVWVSERMPDHLIPHKSIFTFNLKSA